MTRKNFDFESYLKDKSFFLPVKKAYIIAGIIVFALALFNFLMYLPAINIRSLGFDVSLAFYVLLYGGLSALLSGKIKLLINSLKIFGVLCALIFIGILSSLSVFRASAYQNQLVMEEIVDFNKTFKEIELSNIPLVDKDVAITLGDKKIGEVQGLGSQYDIDDIYSIISIEDEIYRVSPLVYQNGIKWLQNRSEGIPGYIKINVNDPNNAELVMLDEGMKISTSGFLHENLFFYTRLHYPTAMIKDYSFELDDNNYPYYVLSTYQPEIGLYGGADANGVIIVDPISGDIKRYNMDNIPSWVDRVQSVDIAIDQLDNWGYYVHGFINTLFGQKDMLQTTNGYNYVTIDSQIYLYTGMTSVGSDHSIVGFGLINLKSKEASFYRVGGADEESAMSSAQGQVQNLGYYATYPILLNIEGIPSYFVSLKDQEGLVKQYAFVSVSNYSLVGVGDTLEDARTNYLNVLYNHRIIGNEQVEQVYESYHGMVESINSAIIDGNTTYFITLADSELLFIVDINISNELPLTVIGDFISIKGAQENNIVGKIIEFDNSKYQY